MFTRKMVRIPFAAALFAVVLFAPGRTAVAQDTDDVVACLDKAAEKLVSCTEALSWKYEALCYSRYASDSILCAPSVLLKKV